MSITTAPNAFSQFFAPIWNEEAFDPDVGPTMTLNDERFGVKRPLTDEEYINLTHEFVSATSQPQAKPLLGTNNFNYPMRTLFADTHNIRLQDFSNFDVRTQNYVEYDVRQYKSPPTYEVKKFRHLRFLQTGILFNSNL